MSSWPSTLPTLQLSDYSETLADNVLRTQMEYGPNKLRRRTVSNVGQMAGSIIIGPSQRLDLITFYTTTVASGTLQWTMRHPVTGATISVRFTGPPQLSAVGNKFRASITLEVLP